MKNFQVGKKVVDSIHGAGIITEISMQRISGQMIECVVIEIVAGRKRVIVPVENMESAELRTMATKKEIEITLRELVNLPQELPKDWRRRIEKLKEKVHSGEPMQIAKAIRDISARSEIKKINPSEKRVLNEAITLLAGEISVVRNVNCDDAKKLIKQLCKENVHKIYEEKEIEDEADKKAVSSEKKTPKKKAVAEKVVKEPKKKSTASAKKTKKPKKKAVVEKAVKKPKKETVVAKAVKKPKKKAAAEKAVKKPKKKKS